MNDLCADIGYKSINHYGEQLCGDHVDIVEQGESSTIVVLADGLGRKGKHSLHADLKNHFYHDGSRSGSGGLCGRGGRHTAHLL